MASEPGFHPCQSCFSRGLCLEVVQNWKALIRRIFFFVSAGAKDDLKTKGPEISM